MSDLKAHEAAAVFSALDPRFQANSQGRHRGRATYRNGDNPTALAIETSKGGLYYDHVTHEGGDVVDYVRTHLNTDFKGACRVIAEITGRDLAGGVQRRGPKYSRYTLIDAELFRVGFCWFLERYLEPLKKLWLLDETAVTTVSIRDATKLLELARSWTPGDAAQFMQRHRQRRFVKQCIAEALRAQAELAHALAPEKIIAAA